VLRLGVTAAADLTVETDWAAAFRREEVEEVDEEEEEEEEEVEEEEGAGGGAAAAPAEEEEEEEVEYGRDHRLSVGGADVQIDLEAPLADPPGGGGVSAVVETLRGLQVRFCRDRFSAPATLETGVSGARRVWIQVHCISIPFWLVLRLYCYLKGFC
jgi:hypothetical protein